LIFAGVAIAMCPPLELELVVLDALVPLVVLELLDPHAATAAAETTAANPQASRLYLMCI
jgi:hypothetical protein